VFGAEVLVAGASAWVVGCSGGSPVLPASGTAGRGSVTDCGWVVVWVLSGW
jgi:hypothetical protein